MKTKVIPAQITTIEDKITNNLNLTQLFLLVAPILFGISFYTVMPVKFRFTTYKIPFILIAFIVFPVLSLRVKGRVLINWLILWFTFLLRSHIYVFNKNDLYLREVLFETEKKQKLILSEPKGREESDKILDLKEAAIDYQIINRNRNINFRMNRGKILLFKD